MSDNEVTAVPATEAALPATIQHQVATARAYPRDVAKFKQSLLGAIEDPDTALQCWYSKPQGGGFIDGPGVRLAELAGTMYANLAVRYEDTKVDRENGRVVATCCVWDMEANTAVEGRCSRSITYNNGNLYANHMIETTIAAAESIAYRQAIFKALPKTYIDEAYQHAKAVINGLLSDPQKQKMIKKHIMDGFSQHGVTGEMIKAVYGESIADMKAEHLKDLIGILNTLRGGSSTWQDITGRGRTLKSSAGINLKSITSAELPDLGAAK